nr:MAG TPA: hypothetical protein [Caudoviricetes sp.]
MTQQPWLRSRLIYILILPQFNIFQQSEPLFFVEKYRILETNKF